jgi:Concanavalin A-like lectin/glucanases superfamily
LVAADKSYMVSYSGGDTTRNFTLGQTNQNYDFILRSSASDLNGMPQLATPTAADVLQASLQHVVLTYDPINGRQIFVNGVSTGVTDPQKGGTISNWDSTFALVLGNEVSSDRSWQGLIKFVAIHNRALTPAQIMQNFNAGVGQRYFVLFNVAAPTGVSQGYVMFTVSQYDSYSYLFYQPTFISLDPTVTSANLPSVAVKGIRIGLNGLIPKVGQAYIPLNTTVTAANYTPAGEVLSNIGTVIGLQNAATDTFFLSFDQLGSQTHVVTEPVPDPQPMTPGPVVADIGVRSFAELNASLSALTGVPTNNAAVLATYQSVQQQLPASNTLESFSSANQVGIAQLAIQYCNTSINSSTYSAVMLPGITVNQASLTGGQISSALAARVLGNAPNSAPAASSITGELGTLITTLCGGSAPCTNQARVQAVAAAACAAAFGSADMLIK